jgi:uncharacterized membrane protein
LEHEALDRRTATERASDSIVKLVGSIQFLLLQVVLVAAWTTINLNLVPGLKPFDPFPFGILALVVSSESVCLTIFVLISQNRMARQAEKRSHLDLQVSMLAEQELTTALQMLQKLCKHMGVDVKSPRRKFRDLARRRTCTSSRTSLKKSFQDSKCEWLASAKPDRFCFYLLADSGPAALLAR